MTGTVDMRRVRQLTRLSKAELIRRCEAAGTLGVDLHRWSRHDLAVEVAHSEERQAVAS